MLKQCLLCWCHSFNFYGNAKYISLEEAIDQNILQIPHIKPQVVWSLIEKVGHQAKLEDIFIFSKYIKDYKFRKLYKNYCQNID